MAMGEGEEEVEEDEVRMEVEAVEAVYGEECVVVDSFPPHLRLRLTPRTADVSSQQFVEAVIGIQAGLRYPEEPPRVYLVDSKGLDEQRKQDLVASISAKASDLSSCLMLVALCEEAVEKLSLMNHPDGDCPLCLYPLVSQDEQSKSLPFMKLMSCFHCFHSECIIRWWHWVQDKKEESRTGSSSSMTPQPLEPLENQDVEADEVYTLLHEENHGAESEKAASCPVCRKVFQTKDFEHVLDLISSSFSQLHCNTADNDDQDLLSSDFEIVRRKRFEATLQLQKDHNGLIEPKKELVVLPGMFLPPPTVLPSDASSKEDQDTERQQSGSRVSSDTKSSGSSSTQFRNSGRRRRKVRSLKNQVRQWARKENGAST